MTVQFGRWNFDDGPVGVDYLNQVQAILAPYGPHSHSNYSNRGISILHRDFPTNRKSSAQELPRATASGFILTWDGLLDNRSILIQELGGGGLAAESSDELIVSCAYTRWGTASFSRLIGDWALSLWNPHDRSLILAKDPIGTRQLYYCLCGESVTWSTILDPLVLLADHSLKLNQEYVAGWLSFFPAADLTPYIGIHAVPPSSFLRLQRGKQAISKYWDFDPARTIRYRRDDEYEEHFRRVFKESVRRRLCSETPVIAELSGGMDSSSIVCMADSILAGGTAETPRLDTISYFDDSEPNWNERPYVNAVESKRGRTGCHIDIDPQEGLEFVLDEHRFAPTPAAGGGRSHAAQNFGACLRSNENRVVLSGIGGDEVLGGVSTPIPELADLIAQGHLATLAHQLKVWALNKRRPWLHLLFETIQPFVPDRLLGVPQSAQPARWLHRDLVERHRGALGYQHRLRLFGALPSFQENLHTLDALRRQLACSVLPTDPNHEQRYPFLDRDLLEFVYAIPREQLVRPGQRRSLMRRALVGTIPDEILNRKRKAFVTRAPVARIRTHWDVLHELTSNSVAADVRIVDSDALMATMRRVKDGKEIASAQLMRFFSLETWLRHVDQRRVIEGLGQPGSCDHAAPTTARGVSPLRHQVLSAEKTLRKEVKIHGIHKA